MTDRTELSGGWRDNVLHDVTRRTGLPAGMPAPIRPPRLLNVTFRVDDL